MTAGSFRVDFALQVDQLTIVMLLTVTFVGMLIHIYSTGYMAHEGGYYRFFSYLNLFMFFMLTLVLAANLIVMFVGWEGVGLCSYLLIGFWFLKKSAIGRRQKSLHHHAHRRLRLHGRHSAALLDLQLSDFGDDFPASGGSMPAETRRTSASSPRFAFCSLPAPSENPRSCRCTSGCRTRWKAPRPSAR